MADYALTDFIRKGQARVQTGVLAENTPIGTIINLQDMTQYDADDTDLGINLGPVDLNVAQAHNVDVAAGTVIYYISVADAKAAAAEIKLIDSGSGLGAGELVRVTTAGDVMDWAYSDTSVATDTMRDVIGTNLATVGENAAGWVRCG